ncbi:hypothetical protein YC2023_016512 [Brassica napus]
MYSPSNQEIIPSSSVRFEICTRRSHNMYLWILLINVHVDSERTCTYQCYLAFTNVETSKYNNIHRGVHVDIVRTMYTGIAAKQCTHGHTTLLLKQAPAHALTNSLLKDIVLLRNEVKNISRVTVNRECLHDLMVVTIDPRNIVVGCDYIIRFVGLKDFKGAIIVRDPSIGEENSCK